MSLIDWKPEYRIGKPAVDEEHRELIDSINALHVALCEGTGATRVAEGLGEIYADIAAHFALEERIMRDARYGEYESHKGDHERLLDQLADIIDAVEGDGTYDRNALSLALDHWFADHFRSHDAKLHGKL